MYRGDLSTIDLKFMSRIRSRLIHPLSCCVYSIAEPGHLGVYRLKIEEILGCFFSKSLNNISIFGKHPFIIKVVGNASKFHPSFSRPNGDFPDVPFLSQLLFIAERIPSFQITNPISSPCVLGEDSQTRVCMRLI